MRTAVIAFAIVAGPALASAAEKKIARKDVPAAVETAVKQEEARGATVKSIVSETEAGQRRYEVTVDGTGRRRSPGVLK